MRGFSDSLFLFYCRARGTASGIVAALCYLMVFAATKTYLDFEHALGMDGIVYLYGAVGVFGLLFFYFLLPETENRTLEDIETHFSTKRITDIKIERMAERSEADRKTGKAGVGIDNVAFAENC